MSPAEIGALATGGLVLLLLAGVPVAVALAAIGGLGMLWGLGPSFTAAQLAGLPFAVAGNFDFAALPLFVLMGGLAEASGMTGQLFRALEHWLARVRGGLYQAVVLGSALFAAVSGSTMVNAMVFTRLAYPRMVTAGYDRSLSIGCIAATGSLAAMIPPSITFVIFAIMTDQSVGRLLIAGAVPGLLSAGVYLIGLAVLVRLRPGLAPPVPIVPVDWRRRMGLTAGAWPFLLLIVPVLGGLYTGAFPASGAGAVGAALALVIALGARRGAAGWLMPVAKDAALVSAAVFAILIGGLLFSRMLVATGVIDGAVDLVTALAGDPISFLILVSVLFLVLGCFLDTTSMLVVTLPFLFPVARELGIDPVWFAVVTVKLIEISVITPPVGVNLFAVMGAAGPDLRMGQVVRGVWPFILMEVLVLALLIAVPSLSTWLPSQVLDG